MATDSTRAIAALGGELVSYTPRGQAPRDIPAIVDREAPQPESIDGAGSYPGQRIKIRVAYDAVDGVTSVAEGFDTVDLKTNVHDAATTKHRVGRIISQDRGIVPGDAGAWYLELIR